MRNKIEERNQSKKIHKKIEIRGINKRTTLYFGEEKREKRGRKRKKKSQSEPNYYSTLYTHYLRT
jgi:hypothetical protein